MGGAATLMDIPVGKRAVIDSATVDGTLNRRLRELGLRSGAEVTVMQKTAGGGRVVKVRGTHYALDTFALKHILVDAAPGESK